MATAVTSPTCWCPGTAIFLPNAALLTDPARRTQFRDDLRRLTEILIARHKNTAAATRPWWFWGRTLRFGNFNAAQTDFGHNIKSYEMIHNANQIVRGPPLVRARLPTGTSCCPAPGTPRPARWNQRLLNFKPGTVERDSEWWIHAEADQTLAALDLSNGFAHQDQLAASAQSWLDVYVDRSSPVRETFARVARVAADNDLRKSFFGKNMLHAHEHALIMYLHGRALEGRPARLYYAFPRTQALTAVAKPYWFDAAGESRTVCRRPGRRCRATGVVEVELHGHRRGPGPALPRSGRHRPTDHASPRCPPRRTAHGWHDGDVTVSLSATDDLVGVKEIHVRVERTTATLPGTPTSTPVTEFVLPPLTDEGDYEITYFAVDRLGNPETPQTLVVRIDRTAPTMAGLPPQPCVIWPPNEKMVHVADVVGSDDLSGTRGRAGDGRCQRAGRRRRHPHLGRQRRSSAPPGTTTVRAGPTRWWRPRRTGPTTSPPQAPPAWCRTTEGGSGSHGTGRSGRGERPDSERHWRDGGSIRAGPRAVRTAGVG